jgi:hypothetical protein
LAADLQLGLTRCYLFNKITRFRWIPNRKIYDYILSQAARSQARLVFG